METENNALAEESPILLPAILIRNGRYQFRKAFIKSYPSFIHFLRITLPQITVGEELLCMLIFLKQNTDDIAAILGISRKSVNQARYRLRLKIQKESPLSLEDFVNQITTYI